MKRFKVAGGPAQFGPGQVIGLSDVQLAARAHAVDVVDDKRAKAKDGFTVVRTRAASAFKVGEVVRLDELPRNLVEIMEPLDAAETASEHRAADLAGKRKPKAGEPLHSPRCPEIVVVRPAHVDKVDAKHNRAEVTVTQADLIAGILKDRGISVAQWNAGDDDSRLVELRTAVERRAAAEK